MAEVTGTIGNENVILDNAATEATLRQLLQATIAAGTKNTKALEDMAKSSGMNPDTIKKVNTELTDQAPKLKKVNVELTEGQVKLLEFGKKLVDGTAQTSDLFSAFSLLPGPLGTVAKLLSLAAAYQQENLKSYQTITTAGVNFGGSLTKLRENASLTYMTLDQFTNMIKNNGDSLVRLGGNANTGAEAFVKLSKSLQDSQFGAHLRGMGFSFEQMNQGMLDYISITGGRTTKELQNTKEIIRGTTEYLDQLDRLAQVTGKSREQQEKELKQAMFEADVQMTMARMTVEDREAFSAAMEEAGTLYGQAGRDIVLAQAQGRAVTGEGGKLLTATASGAAQTIANLQNIARQYGRNSQEFLDASNKSRLQAQESLGEIPTTVFSVNKDFAKIGDASKTVARDMMNGMTNKKAMDEADKEREKTTKERNESQAKAMADAQKGMQELSQALISLISPIVAFVTPAFKILGSIAGTLGQFLSGLPEPIRFVISSLGALGAAFLLHSRRMAAQAAAETAKSAAGTAAGVGEKLAGAGGASAGGGGFVAFIRTLGRTLASLAPIAVPMLIGAGAVAGVIAILGAGVAAAIALIGLSLPVFAKGLKEVAEIDGMNLAKIALGLTLLGPALAIFTASSFISGIGAVGTRIANFFSGGGPIALIQESVGKLAPILPQITSLGPALNSYAQGIAAFGDAVGKVDIAKAERLKEVLKGPGVLEGIGTAVRDVGRATATLITSNAAGAEKSGNDMAALNTKISELVRLTKEMVDYNKRQLDATKSLNGNVFA